MQNVRLNNYIVLVGWSQTYDTGSCPVTPHVTERNEKPRRTSEIDPRNAIFTHVLSRGCKNTFSRDNTAKPPKKPPEIQHRKHSLTTIPTDYPESNNSSNPTLDSIKKRANIHKCINLYL